MKKLRLVIALLALSLIPLTHLNGVWLSDVEEVQAVGEGTTEDEALKQAIRNAVRQVVATFVTAEGVTKNDQVIKDEVLTVSRGFVEQVLSRRGAVLSNGSHQVEIRCIVRRGRVYDALRKSNVQPNDFDGASIHATTVSERVFQQDANQLFSMAVREFLKEYPHIYKYEYQSHQVLRPGKDNTTIRVTYRFTLQEDRYFNEMLPDLCGVLKQVAQDNLTTTNARLRNVRLTPLRSEAPLDEQSQSDVKKVREWYAKGWEVVTVQQRTNLIKYALEKGILNGCDLRAIYDGESWRSCILRMSSAFIVFQDKSGAAKYVHPISKGIRFQGDRVISDPTTFTFNDTGEAEVVIPTNLLPEISKVIMCWGLLATDYAHFDSNLSGFFDGSSKKPFCYRGYFLWGHDLKLQEGLSDEMQAAAKRNVPIYYLGKSVE